MGTRLWVGDMLQHGLFYVWGGAIVTYPVRYDTEEKDERYCSACNEVWPRASFCATCGAALGNLKMSIPKRLFDVVELRGRVKPLRLRADGLEFPPHHIWAPIDAWHSVTAQNSLGWNHLPADPEQAVQTFRTQHAGPLEILQETYKTEPEFSCTVLCWSEE